MLYFQCLKTKESRVQVMKEIANIIQIVKNKQNYKHPFLGDGYRGVVYNINGFAVKIRRSWTTEDMHNEAKKLQFLQCTEMVPEYVYHEKDFIIMEYVQGKTLRQLYEEGGMLSQKQIQQLSFMLDATEFTGLLPRDLNLGNVIMTKTGRFKLIDVDLYIPVESATNKQKERAYLEKQCFLKKLSNPIEEEIIA